MDEDLPSKHFPETHFLENSHPKTILQEWNKDSSSTDPDRSHENPYQGEMLLDYHKNILEKDVLLQTLPSSTCGHSNWESNACHENMHHTNIECSVFRDECGNVTYQNEMPLLKQNKNFMESSIPEQQFLKKKRRTKIQNFVEGDIQSPESVGEEESFQHFTSLTDSSNSVIIKRGNDSSEEKDKVSLACKTGQDICSRKTPRTTSHMRSIEIQMSPVKSRIASAFGEDSVEHKDESMEVDLQDCVDTDLNDPEEPSSAEEDFDGPQEGNQYSGIEEPTAIGSDTLLNEGGTDADGNYSSSAGEECSEETKKPAGAAKSSEQGTVSNSSENKEEVVDKQNSSETEVNGILSNRTENVSLSGTVFVNNDEKSKGVNNTREGKEDKIVTNENENLPVSESNVVNNTESYEMQIEKYETSDGNTKLAVTGEANNKCEFNPTINSQENIKSKNNDIYARHDKGKSEETKTVGFEEKGERTERSIEENFCEQLEGNNNIRDCIISSKEEENLKKILENNFEGDLDDASGIISVASAEFGEKIEDSCFKFDTLVKREDSRDVRKDYEVPEEKREKRQLESEIFCSLNEESIHESKAHPEVDISSFETSDDVSNEISSQNEKEICDISQKIKCEVRTNFSENVEDFQLNKEVTLDISDVNLQNENNLKTKEEGSISSHFNDLNVGNLYTDEIEQSYIKIEDNETKNTLFQINEYSKNYEKIETFDNLYTRMGNTPPDLKHELTISNETDEVTLSTSNGEKINAIADEENMRIAESTASNDLDTVTQNNDPETEAEGILSDLIAQKSTIRIFSGNDGEEIRNQQYHKVEELNTSDRTVALPDSSHVKENKVIAPEEAVILQIKSNASPELINNSSSQNVELPANECSIKEVPQSEERDSTMNEFSISDVESTVNRHVSKMQAPKSVRPESELSARNPSIRSLENCTQKENISAKIIPDEKAAQNVCDTSKVVSPRKGIKVEEDEIETAISSVQFYEEISDSNGIIEHEAKNEKVGENYFGTATRNECMPCIDDFELKSSDIDEHKGEDNSAYPNLESPSRVTGVEKTAKSSSSPKKRLKRRKLPRSRSAPHKDGVSSAPQKTQDSKGGKGNHSEKLAPRSSSSTTTRTPSTTEKKIPPIKAPVGNAPPPKIKQAKSKIGSLDNVTHKPKGGEKKVETVKLEWNAKPKVGSLDYATHKPGGGDKKIITQKIDFKNVQSKVGSKDNIKYKPGGGNVKVTTEKLDFKSKVTSKVGSLENAKHKPGGGNITIKSEKLHFKEKAAPKIHSRSGSERGSSHGGSETQSPVMPSSPAPPEGMPPLCEDENPSSQEEDKNQGTPNETNRMEEEVTCNGSTGDKGPPPLSPDDSPIRPQKDEDKVENNCVSPVKETETTNGAKGIQPDC